MWNDKFDYVFRVKLKELLNESWSREYEPSELRQDKVGCFIHYCLTHSAKFSKSEKIQLLKDILSIEEKQKDKVLLLLDGYDEVAHLNMSNRNDFQDIIDEVSEYKNVIMSSRPNAVVEEMSSQFERKVENTGWDMEGIEKYINKNFENDKDKEFGVQLKSFLAVNNQIKEICEVPINTALICLVWEDKDIRYKFQKNNQEDFNISQLYHEVVIWLGKNIFRNLKMKE
ncbi:hypothetical protein RMONA_07145 [Rickettsia monacensis]|uniref:NACHT domain-containing protein n=1 Tax=Rickettsia monacensis TaxID=109232 RepID=A0A0B7J137_9RICK|nr:hypothetical protein RMONA_07145 [Rickettsia monacensis]